MSNPTLKFRYLQIKTAHQAMNPFFTKCGVVSVTAAIAEASTLQNYKLVEETRSPQDFALLVKT